MPDAAPAPAPGVASPARAPAAGGPSSVPTEGGQPFSFRGGRAVGAAGRTPFAEAVAYCVGLDACDVTVGFDARGVPQVEARLASVEAAVARRRLDDATERAARVRAGPAAAAFGTTRAAGVEPAAGGPHFRTVGPGLAVGSPLAARVLEAVDRLLLAALGPLGAEPLAVPALVATDVLDLAGYGRSFAHHLTGCWTAGDLDAVVELGRRLPAGEPAPPGLRAAPVANTPAACHNVYAYLAGDELDGDAAFTVRAACARHEPGGFSAGERHWSFTMREMVFAGTAAGAQRFLAAGADAVRDLVGRLGLPCEMCTATDAFFVTTAERQAAYQAATRAKHELAAELPGGGVLAVASWNRHRTHFADAFAITAPGGAAAHTACIGFGLERWATWLLAWLGDAAPAALAELAVPSRPEGEPHAWT